MSRLRGVMCVFALLLHRVDSSLTLPHQPASTALIGWPADRLRGERVRPGHLPNDIHSSTIPDSIAFGNIRRASLCLCCRSHLGRQDYGRMIEEEAVYQSCYAGLSRLQKSVSARAGRSTCNSATQCYTGNYRSIGPMLWLYQAFFALNACNPRF